MGFFSSLSSMRCKLHQEKAVWEQWHKRFETQDTGFRQSWISHTFQWGTVRHILHYLNEWNLITPIFGLTVLTLACSPLKIAINRRICQLCITSSLSSSHWRINCSQILLLGDIELPGLPQEGEMGKNHSPSIYWNSLRGSIYKRIKLIWGN